jgi:hypothetical protein
MKACALLVGCVALLATTGANAQSKMSGSLKCGKPEVNQPCGWKRGVAPG